MHITDKEIERFWSKVDIRQTEECWPWVAKSRHWNGYGVMRISSMGRNVVASRISCFLAFGPPPAGLKNSLHSCDNPACCNPAHLRWGSPKDNAADAIERKRNVNPPRIIDNPEWLAKQVAAMPKGEAVHNSKLTEPVVRKIWQMHLAGRNASDIAASVGHSAAAVYDVCRGRSWRHLSDAPSLEDLKAGGVQRGFNQFSSGGDTRALNPNTKIPSSEIPSILSRIEAGETLQSIGETYGVLKSAIWRIKKTANQNL